MYQISLSDTYIRSDVDVLSLSFSSCHLWLQLLISLSVKCYPICVNKVHMFSAKIFIGSELSTP